MAWPVFTAVVALFVTCLITANIIAGDVLTEVYGYATARRVIWLGFGCNVVVVRAILLAGEFAADLPRRRYPETARRGRCARRRHGLQPVCAGS